MTEEKSAKILVLIDLNGTLIHRSITENKKSSLILGEGDFKKWIILRSGTTNLLERLFEEKEIHVGFYTSMTKKNAKPIVDHIMMKTKLKLPFYKNKISILDREFNKIDPHGMNAWDTIRDPDAVWLEMKKKGFSFDKKNTIFVDNDLRKVREVAGSAIILPSWDGVDTSEEPLRMTWKTIISRIMKFEMTGDVSSADGKEQVVGLDEVSEEVPGGSPVALENKLKSFDLPSPSGFKLPDISYRDVSKRGFQIRGQISDDLAQHVEAILKITRGDPQSLLRVIGALTHDYC